MNNEWWKDAIVYQIYPRSFQDSNDDGIGDINGIITRLDYIRDLGVDVIWLCPIYPSPGADNGYDISDYYGIDPQFGTMQDFENFLFEAHSRGIRVIMDMVLNHTSDEHPWFVESKSSRDNPLRNYYIWSDSKPNNWSSWFGGSAWEYDNRTCSHYFHIFAKKQPDLNWANPKLREEIYAMLHWWLNKGVDGFRLDVISLISKPDIIPFTDSTDLSPWCINGPYVHEYLREMNQQVFSHYDIMTVGECPSVTIEEAENYSGFERKELNMVFQFEHTSLTDGPFGKWTDARTSLPALKQVLSKWQLELRNKAWNCLFWSNHDQPRAVSKFGCDLPEYRDISAKMLCMCLYLMQGTPYIYQGEEIGMANAGFYDIARYQDIESINFYQESMHNGQLSKRTALNYLAFISRDNARTPMQWSNELYGGFSSKTPWIDMGQNWRAVNVEREEHDSGSVLSFYKEVLKFRKGNPIIRDGEFELIYPDDEKLFAYKRKLDDKMLLVLCNFSSGSYILPEPDLCNNGMVVLSNYRAKIVPKELKPYEAIAILFSE